MWGDGVAVTSIPGAVRVASDTGRHTTARVRAVSLTDWCEECRGLVQVLGRIALARDGMALSRDALLVVRTCLFSPIDMHLCFYSLFIVTTGWI